MTTMLAAPMNQAGYHRLGGAARYTSECDASHANGRRTRVRSRSKLRHHLQIIGNKANYTRLQRDTGTELSVLLVP